MSAEETQLKKHQETIDKLRKHVETSFTQAEKGISQITNEILTIEGMSGTATRHFYNNICSLPGALYLEVGAWKGSTFVSAMYKNQAHGISIDNWTEFGGPKVEFSANLAKFIPEAKITVIDTDSFSPATLDQIKNDSIDIYVYDGDHSYEAQYKAVTMYKTKLKPVSILIVDDFNWLQVQRGTRDAIRDSGLKVEFEKVFLTSQNGEHAHVDLARQSFWNGIFVAVLSKA
jgi:hypothetical protein